MNKKIIISDLSLDFDKNAAFSNINFDLNESEIGCILGPSGCGKTSLLRAIAGFRKYYRRNYYKRWCMHNKLENTPVQKIEKMGMVFKTTLCFLTWMSNQISYLA